MALRLQQIVREEGAIPATIALLDGHIRVGLSDEELERISQPETKAVKVSRRDLANCLAEKVRKINFILDLITKFGQKVGGTTVAATM